MTLKLFADRGHSKSYSNATELIEFGRVVCGVAHLEQVLTRIHQGMRETLQAAQSDERVPKDLLAQMRQAWEPGLAIAAKATKTRT